MSVYCYICTVCYVAYTTQEALQNHKLKHSYFCNVCRYKAGTIGILNVHKRTHIVDKKFICNYEGCKYKGYTRNNLLRHRKSTHCLTNRGSNNTPINLRVTQYNINRYSCEYSGCHYQGRSQYNLQNHVKKHFTNN